MSFETFFLNRKNDIFLKLAQSAEFESFGEGRAVAILVDMKSNEKSDLVPIVRTTTVYQKQSQTFSPIHREIATEIANALKLDAVSFNNAMMELYTPRYRKMGFHCDQALDLEPNSHIAIYSCYNSKEEARLRKLVIKDKVSDLVVQEIIMENNLVIVFSVETNKKYLHKIVLADASGNVDESDSKWIGITFRTSKTWLELPQNAGKKIYLASKEQVQEFRRLKSQENAQIDFSYPPIDYTISPSDLMAPTCSLALNNHHRSNSTEKEDNE